MPVESRAAERTRDRTIAEQTVYRSVIHHAVIDSRIRRLASMLEQLAKGNEERHETERTDHPREGERVLLQRGAQSDDRDVDHRRGDLLTSTRHIVAALGAFLPQQLAAPR